MIFIPKNSPAWLAASKVTGTKPIKIEFTGNTTVKSREAAIEASILEDPHKRHNAVEKIIMRKRQERQTKTGQEIYTGDREKE